MQTYDLLPRGSGLAHIGANGFNGGTGFSEIIPYGTIHILSGVFHAPYGTSGVIRFNQQAGYFEFSLNGGKSFTSFRPTLTLQEAYLNGATITVDSTGGNLQIAADTAKTVFSSEGTRAPFRITPMEDPPSSSTSKGDIWFSDHAIIDRTLGYSAAQVKARSLGLGSLVYDTGSGIINVTCGSGIAQFSASAAQIIATGQGSLVPFNTIDIGDANFVINDTNAGGSGIKVFTPGVYEISYTCNLDRLAGAGQHVMETSILKNFTANLDPSSSFSYHKDTTFGKGTSNATVLVELTAGDSISIRIRFSTTAASNEVTTIAEECWIILKYVGPPRNTEITV